MGLNQWFYPSNKLHFFDTHSNVEPQKKWTWPSPNDNFHGLPQQSPNFRRRIIGLPNMYVCVYIYMCTVWGVYIYLYLDLYLYFHLYLHLCLYHLYHLLYIYIYIPHHTMIDPKFFSGRCTPWRAPRPPAARRWHSARWIWKPWGRPWRCRSQAGVG